jgi:hypothetical protein
MWTLQTQGGCSAATAALQWMRDTFGMRNLTLDSTVDDCLGLASLWLSAIEAHESLPEQQRSAQAIRDLYEDAIDRFNQPNIWRAYRAFEVREQDHQRAGALVWRAQQCGVELNLST